MSPLEPKRLAMGLAAIVATACAAGAVSAATDAPTDVGGYRVPVVSDAQAKAIAVLARDQQPDEAIDTDAAGPMAANPRLARRIDTAAGPAWVVPADAHVCLRAMDASDPVWTCVSDDDAAAGKLLLTLRDADDNLQAVYGVLPAGSGNARLAGPRKTAAASAPDGVIGVRTTDADSVVFTDAQGSRHTVDLP